MRSLAGSLLFGAVVAFMLLSPILIGLVILLVLGLLAAALTDLFTAIRGGSGSSGGRQYWRPGQ